MEKRGLHRRLKNDRTGGKCMVFCRSSLSHNATSTPALGFSHLPNQWVPASFSATKRSGRKANHSPSSNSEVKGWSLTSVPPYVYMVWCLVKHRDYFTSIVTVNCCLKDPRHIIINNNQWLSRLACSGITFVCPSYSRASQVSLSDVFMLVNLLWRPGMQHS